MLHVAPAVPEVFTVYVRIPGWSKHSTVRVNGDPVNDVVPASYLPIRRRWSGNDMVEISFDMQPQVTHANPAVDADTGRIALQRGPVVFCMEQLDQADTTPQDFPGFSALSTEETESRYEPALLDGVVILTHPGAVGPAPSQQSLYEASLPGEAKTRSASLQLIPYYAWANREPTPMQVWIPYERS